MWRGGVSVRDERWLERVNRPLSAGDLQRLKFSAERGRPYGDEAWTNVRAQRLGLESTLRSRGAAHQGGFRFAGVVHFSTSQRPALVGPTCRINPAVLSFSR